MDIFKKECPGSNRIKYPYPEEIRCRCGYTVEIWTDQASAICPKCKREVTREILPLCLDWCLMAKACMGEKRYEKYLNSKNKKKGDD